MFRAAALAIALTLAIGPDAALLCGLWCDLHAVAEAGCRHLDSAPSSRVAASEDCCDAAVVAAAILPRDGRGIVTSPDGDFAMAVHLRLAMRMATVRPGHHPGRRWSLDARPLATALRI